MILQCAATSTPSRGMPNDDPISHLLDDRFGGTTGDDRLDGTSHDDILEGRAGDDRLNGGQGIDIAQTAALRLQCSFGNPVGSTTLIGPEGHDSLISIEILRFADGTMYFDDRTAGAEVSRLYLAALG